MTHISAALDNLMNCIKTGLKGTVEETRAENDESGVGNLTTSRPKLTCHEIRIIARMLVSECHFGTCAALNVVSKCVWAVTLPVLWKTFVLSGADLYNKLSACWDEGDVESDRGKEIVREWSKKWDQAMESVGCLFIEYIVAPTVERPEPLPSSVEAASKTQPRFPTSHLKAIIRIAPLPVLESMQDNGSGEQQTIFVELTAKYRPATIDAFDLRAALVLLHKTGNQRIKDTFHGPNGVMLKAYSSVSAKCPPAGGKETSLPSVKEAITRLAALRRESDCESMEWTVNIWSIEKVGPESMALTFLDVLHWMKIEKGESHNETIDVRHESTEGITACARAYQKAVKVDPALVSLWIRFTLYNAPLSATLLPEMDKVGAIIRGTYLSTRPHLSLNELGVFTLRSFPKGGKLASWSVYAERRNDQIATMLCTDGAVVSTIHDIWGANNS